MRLKLHVSQPHKIYTDIGKWEVHENPGLLLHSAGGGGAKAN